MAAGLGFKDFQTGEVLTAADVDGYLMQGIWVFDDATARDAAVTSPQEGNACYLKDTNEVLTYSGSTWVAVGGGSPLTTKGDLFTFSTTDARLAVGANGTTLVADSAETTGLKWATPSIGGITLLSTTSLTGATTTISAIDQTYKSLLAVIFQVTNATADGAFRCAPNGTTNITTGSGTRLDMNQYNESYLFISGPAASTVDRTQNTNAYSLQIFDYANTTYFKPFLLGGNHFQSGHGGVAVNYGGSIKTTSAITSLVFSNSGGNLSTGTVLLYGVK